MYLDKSAWSLLWTRHFIVPSPWSNSVPSVLRTYTTCLVMILLRSPHMHGILQLLTHSIPSMIFKKNLCLFSSSFLIEKERLIISPCQICFVLIWSLMKPGPTRVWSPSCNIQVGQAHDILMAVGIRGVVHIWLRQGHQFKSKLELCSLCVRFGDSPRLQSQTNPQWPPLPFQSNEEIVPGSTLQVPINEGNSAVVVLPGLKLGVGDARDEIENMQQCRSWINHGHLQLKKLCASMCNSENIWAKCYTSRSWLLAGAWRWRSCLCSGSSSPKLETAGNSRNYYCRVKFALIILFKSRDPPGSYATVAGSRHVGNARFFHFERLGLVFWL